MSDIYRSPGHLIRRMQQISASVFADHMRAAGFDLTSTQYAALSLLADRPGIDQATLAGLIAVDRPTMGGIVDRLAGKGFVARRVNPNDRRARILSLTKHGEFLLTQLTPVVEESQARLLEGLTDQERADFLRLAERVAETGNAHSRAPLKPQDDIEPQAKAEAT